MTEHATSVRAQRRGLPAVIALAVLTGCQTSGPHAPPPEPLIVHLTEEACALEGSQLFFTQTMPVHAVNDTGNLFNLELIEPTAGHTHDDIAALYEEAQGALHSGEPLPTPPSWMTEVARLEVGAGMEADLESPMGVGSYTILCGQIHPPDELYRVQVLGPVDVTEAQ